MQFKELIEVINEAEGYLKLVEEGKTNSSIIDSDNQVLVEGPKVLDDDDKTVLIFTAYDNLDQLSSVISEILVSLRKKFKFTKKAVAEYFAEEPGQAAPMSPAP